MATNALTNDKLRELHARHLSEGSAPAWSATIQQDLRRFQALSPDEFDDHEAHAALWATTGIASLGQTTIVRRTPS